MTPYDPTQDGPGTGAQAAPRVTGNEKKKPEAPPTTAEGERRRLLTPAGAFRVVRTAVKDFFDDRVLTHAAALAFYTALSLPPLLVVLVWGLGTIGAGGEAHLRSEAEELVGQDAAQVVDSILENSDRISFGSLSGLIGVGALLFAASGVFTQLQAALNVVWEVEQRPGAGLRAWIRKRLASFGLIGVLAFLMLVSLAASTLIRAVGIGDEERILLQALNWAFSLGLFTVLFALVFRLLPDAEIRWGDVWGGALVTAGLFALGKYAIGAYLAHRGLGTTYGAAGSAIVVLAWVYFNAAILLFGAELTQSWLRHAGRPIVPSAYAVRAGS